MRAGIEGLAGSDAWLLVTQIQAYKTQMDGGGVRDVIAKPCVRALTLSLSPATAFENASTRVHGLPELPSPPPPAALLTYRSVSAISQPSKPSHKE